MDYYKKKTIYMKVVVAKATVILKNFIQRRGADCPFHLRIPCLCVENICC